MTLPALVWGSPGWMTAALGLMAVALAAIIWSYARAQAKPGLRVACGLLKTLGLAALVISIVEPLLTGLRPRRGANAFAIVVDNSQSLQIRDDPESPPRGDQMRDLLQAEAAWRTRLGQDFDVRTYVFDSHLRAVEGYEQIKFDGTGSALGTSLAALAKRFRGLPLAGVLVLTDGNRTDIGDVDWSQLPPVYPAAPPARGRPKDIGISQLTVSQTNFDSAPAVVRAEVVAQGYRNERIVAAVVDEEGEEIERQEQKAPRDASPLSFRFQFRPARRGINFYKVNTFAASDEKSFHQAEPSASEQTLANNTRLVVIDQGGGPYRILYVGGRPNWEYKFLHRAVDHDEQVEVVGLLRIARKQPKFDFRDVRDRSLSPFYKGFEDADKDTAERYDQPVLVRLGTLDEVELRDGFPKAADELYRYHAVVIDDIESAFFSPDQQTLLRNFVNQRGGGLLMLGGPDSFINGKYDRTPIGELLPVYLHRSGLEPSEGEFRLLLTREGWLQPWVRTRKTEDDERKRLSAMPAFHTLSMVGTIKPGAMVLAEVRDAAGTNLPALVAQQFGKGHVAALLIGDLWRWGMKREKPEEDDLDRSWRQTLRWLVADVPERVEISLSPKDESQAGALQINVRVRDAEYLPLDNARVTVKVSLPGGDTLALDAEPDGTEAGTYAATYVPRQPGAYRFLATATAPDGSAVGEREAGWAAQPSADEFARLEPDREYLATIAAKTKGEVLDPNRLDAFVSSLSSRHAPISEPWTSPLWHQPLYFLFAIICLTAEWGLRRINGLA